MGVRGPLGALSYSCPLSEKCVQGPGAPGSPWAASRSLVLDLTTEVALGPHPCLSPQLGPDPRMVGPVVGGSTW